MNQAPTIRNGAFDGSSTYNIFKNDYYLIGLLYFFLQGVTTFYSFLRESGICLYFPARFDIQALNNIWLKKSTKYERRREWIPVVGIF